MPRLKKDRLISKPPIHTSFKSTGVTIKNLETIYLPLDEDEALRLNDLKQFDLAQAADKMNISRPTFSRLITQARHKIAIFLTEGKHLTIEGENIDFSKNVFKCHDCGHLFNTNINISLSTCPICGSNNITDLAEDMEYRECW